MSYCTWGYWQPQQAGQRKGTCRTGRENHFNSVLPKRQMYFCYWQWAGLFFLLPVTQVPRKEQVLHQPGYRNTQEPFHALQLRRSATDPWRWASRIHVPESFQHFCPLKSMWLTCQSAAEHQAVSYSRYTVRYFDHILAMVKDTCTSL